MNLQTFLLRTPKSGSLSRLQLLKPPFTRRTEFQKDSHSGLRFPRLWFSVKAVLTLWLPLLEYAQAVVAGLRAVVSGHGKADA